MIKKGLYVTTILNLVAYPFSIAQATNPSSSDDSQKDKESSVISPRTLYNPEEAKIPFSHSFPVEINFAIFEFLQNFGDFFGLIQANKSTNRLVEDYLKDKYKNFGESFRVPSYGAHLKEYTKEKRWILRLEANLLYNERYYKEDPLKKLKKGILYLKELKKSPLYLKGRQETKEDSDLYSEAIFNLMEDLLLNKMEKVDPIEKRYQWARLLIQSKDPYLSGLHHQQAKEMIASLCKSEDPFVRAKAKFFAWKHELLHKKSEPQGEKLLEDAAQRKGTERGYFKAAFDLGKLYEQKESEFGRNDNKAFDLYEKAAQDPYGYAPAQYALAKMYWQGKAEGAGFQDREKAYRLFQKSALQGNAKSQYKLGLLWYIGYEGPKKFPPLRDEALLQWVEEWATHWWGYSAIQGNRKALFGSGKGEQQQAHTLSAKYAITREALKDMQNPEIPRIDLTYKRLGWEKSFLILRGLAEAPSLQKLILKSNNIFFPPAKALEVALRKAKKLTTLDLSDNQVGDTGAQALAQNQILIKLGLRRNQVGDTGAQTLAQNQTITTLDLSDNQVGPKGAQALAQNQRLKTLDLNTNQVGDTGAQALAQNETLTTLNLGENKVRNLGAEALAQNQTLKILNLNMNQIGPKGAQALAQNQTITTLDLSYNQVGDTGAQTLAQNQILIKLGLRRNQVGDTGAQTLAQNQTITTLDLSDNQVGPKGAQALAQNQTITTLDLSYNQVGDTGAEALAQNQMLIFLNLGRNQIGAKGAQTLAQNQTITTLDLSYNQVGDTGAEALAQNQILTFLDLCDNQIGPKGAQALAQNQTITDLNLNENKAGAKGAQALAQNQTITTLYLRSNQIGDIGAQTLAQNQTITFLDLSSNQIGDTGVQALAQNQTITDLGLSKNQAGDLGAEALTRNQMLTVLSLTENHVGDKVQEIINEMLERNKKKANTVSKTSPSQPNLSSLSSDFSDSSKRAHE